MNNDAKQFQSDYLHLQPAMQRMAEKLLGNEQDAADVDDYVKRFCLKGATLDAIMSLIFRMGLREMKAQTDLDRFLDEQDEQNKDKVEA